MDVDERDIGIRHDSVETAARRQSALQRWHGHAEALQRVGLLDEEECWKFRFTPIRLTGS
jgi:hypothetical protein